VRDQSQIWSATYDREAGSFLGLQDELGVAIADRVRVRLSPERAVGLAGSGTRNSEAYDLYLRGRFCMFQVTPAAGRKAAEYFERAAALDPDYALAYAGLADVYANLPINSDADPKPAWRKAREAAERALGLDDQLAEVHASLGTAKFWFDWDWVGAERCFRRALALDPNFAWAHLTLAMVRSHLGRHDESAAVMSKCLALDPVSPLAHAIAGQFLFQARANSAALERLRYALAIDGEFWIGHIAIGKVYEQLGRSAAALDAFQQALAYSGGNTEALSLKAYVLATTGRSAEAEDVMAALQQIAVDKFVPPYNIALVAAGLGDARLAFEWLEKAYEARDVHMVFLPIDPKWDRYRLDQRFSDLLRRCNFQRRPSSSRSADAQQRFRTRVSPS
jgi:tetratricopeptide (TPR) repeat protein